MTPQNQAALLMSSARWHRDEAANYLRHSTAAMHQHERAAEDLERAAAKLLQSTQDADHAQCPHCEEVTHLGGLIGATTDNCPRCGQRVIYN